MQEEEWKLSRRKFVSSILLGGIAMQLPWVTACSSENELPKNLYPLQAESFQNLRAVLNVLFPEDDFGPSALQVKADTYILWVLNDPELDPDENRYIIEKLDLLQEFSRQKQDVDFYQLSFSDQQELIEKAIELDWGKRFFSRLLTLTFEALLIHPLYEVNPNEMGWLWLEHNPGHPKASKELMYPQILRKKDEV